METRHNRDSTCCTSRVSSVIRYCTSSGMLDSEHMYYYYYCGCEDVRSESSEQTVTQGQADSFWHSTWEMVLRRGLHWESYFLWTAWFITVDRRAPGDRDEVTVWLSPAHYQPPTLRWRQLARLSADSLYNTHNTHLRFPGNALHVTLSCLGVTWCQYQCFAYPFCSSTSVFFFLFLI